MIARLTIAGIRNELDTLYRHTGMTITIERTDKDGNADAAGRYVNVIVPSGVTSTGIICNNLTDAYNTIRQYLAQAGIVPSTDTFPANNLTAAVAAHHRRFVASLNDPQPEPPAPATTIDIASKYGTFTYQMAAWRCADKGNGGIASYPTWHETLDAHEWLDYRPLTTDRIRRIVTTWPAQNIATVELDNGYWYQVRYETMPAPAPEPYEPGVFGGAHPGDDEDTEDAPAFVPAPSPMLAKAIAENRKRQAARKQRNSPAAAIARAEAAWDAEDAETEAERRMAEMAANVTLTDLRNLHAIHPDHARDHARHIIDTTDVSAPMTPETRPALVARHAQIETARAWLDATNPAPEPPAPTPDYATIPAIGGGSHEADTQPAKKARPRVWFACPGCGKSVHTSRGITINGETWHKACHEPQPAKQRTKATSQKRDNQRAERAALNEAYHANAETHAPDIAAILTDLGFTVTEQRESGETPVTIWQSDEATIKQTPYTLRVYNGQPKRLSRHGDAEIINSVEAGWIMRTQPTGYAAGVVAAILPLIETPDPYMQALDAIEAREAEQSAPLPELVLHGGQPSMSGPWQVPVISGGSQDAETLSCADCGITSDDTDINPATFGDRAPRCWECMVAYIAYTDRLTCHHDADEPPARFCSQCGHDAHPDAPRPTDTGTEHGPHQYECIINTEEARMIAGFWSSYDDPETGALDLFHRTGTRGIELHQQAWNLLQRRQNCRETIKLWKYIEDWYAKHPTPGGNWKPTDTGQSYDVLPLTKRYTRRTLEKKCAEASAILGKHVEVIQDPVSKRYAVTEDLPERMRNNPGEWLRERDCNTIRYWIEHLDASIRKHRACISATDFGYQLVGDEMTDMFPWAVVALPSGQIIERYSHRAVADQVADRMRMDRCR